MPDCHYGKGATIGTVLATKGSIIPAAVGVDIGCGMIAVQTPLKRDDIADLAAMRSGIERRIPMSAGPQQSDHQRQRRQRVSKSSSRWPDATTATSIRTGSCSSARSAAATTSSSSRPTNRIRCGPRCTRARAASATRSATCTSAARKTLAKSQRGQAARPRPRLSQRRHEGV